MFFQNFGPRKSPIAHDRSPRPHITDLAGIRREIFQQARSAVGSEVRGLRRALRRLIPSKQPMGQLRTQWRCQENSATASSRSERPWNFEVFVFRIFGRGHAKT